MVPLKYIQNYLWLKRLNIDFHSHIISIYSNTIVIFIFTDVHRLHPKHDRNNNYKNVSALK